MAITVPNSTTYAVTGFPTTHPINAFNTAGTDPFLVVAGFNKNPVAEVTTTTTDGNTMTLMGSNVFTNVCAIQAYGKVPTDSSQDIVSNTPTNKEQAMIAINVNGVNGSDPYRFDSGTMTAGNFGTGVSCAPTGTSGNIFLVFVATQADQAFTPNGCTELQDFAHAGGIGSCFAGWVACTGSSQTVGATWTGSTNARVCVVEIKASTGTPPSPRRLFMIT